MRWWRRRPPGDPTRRLVAGYLAAAVAVPVVFFALVRYRLPIEVLLIVFAAGWLGERAGGPGVAPGGTTLDRMSGPATPVGPR